MVKRIIGGLCLALALTSCNGNKGKVHPTPRHHHAHHTD